jgi:hydrogenase maturation protease
MSRPRTLVAGIGNVFLGDDGFGVEVVRRLALRALPEDVQVSDFGIRGFDLVYALLDGYASVILVDTAPRGGPPGTLYVIEPILDAEEATPSLATHGMDPMRVLELARAMGGHVEQLVLVGCEPAVLAEEGECVVGLSPPVAAAVDSAVETIESLIRHPPAEVVGHA